MLNINFIGNFKILILSFIIFLSAKLILNYLPPIWILLSLELIFFQFIVLFLVESMALSEIYGYLISYSLIISIALESAILLGIMLILNKNFAGN